MHTEADGKWPAVLIALGIPAKILDGKHHPCPLPGCGGKDRFRFDDDGTGSYICSQCGSGRGFRLLRKLHGWDFRQAASEVDRVLGGIGPAKPKIERARMTREDVARIWRTSKPLRGGDAVQAHFVSRGIHTWPTKALRYEPSMWHSPTRTCVPCLLALFRSADGKEATVHRTYLGDVEPRRMFVPYTVPKGGAIRLFDADRCMGVAEGIETALSASLLFKLPVWACANEGMLRLWQPPEDAKHITIFGDNDSSAVGQAASWILAKRLLHDGFHVEVKIPPSPDWDWNDVLKNEIETERYPDLPPLRSRGDAAQPAGQSLSNT